MLQQVLALLSVLALLGGALFLLRRKGLAQFRLPGYGSTRRTGEIKLLDRMPLTPQHSLVLVHIENEKILIGVSPSGCQLITGFGTTSNFPARSNEQCAGS